jgi:hypothetical protein
LQNVDSALIFRLSGESNEFSRASTPIAQGDPIVMKARIVKVIIVG